VSGNLPAGDGNGLSAIVSELIRDPKRMHVCICIIDTKKVTTDADSGDVTPTARIRRIEVIADSEDMRVAERLMRRSLDQRTGREALPYDLEAELSEVFERLDHTDEGARRDEDQPE
jgi:hypothetical protein